MPRSGVGVQTIFGLLMICAGSDLASASIQYSPALPSATGCLTGFRSTMGAASAHEHTSASRQDTNHDMNQLDRIPILSL